MSMLQRLLDGVRETCGGTAAGVLAYLIGWVAAMLVGAGVFLLDVTATGLIVIARLPLFPVWVHPLYMAGLVIGMMALVVVLADMERNGWRALLLAVGYLGVCALAAVCVIAVGTAARGFAGPTAEWYLVPLCWTAFFHAAWLIIRSAD